MGFKAKKPKKTAEERALESAQARELDRTGEALNEKKRRTLRSEIGGRGSLLSGSERGIRPGEQRLGRATSATSTPGRTGVPGRPRAPGSGGGGGSFRGSGGRRRVSQV